MRKSKAAATLEDQPGYYIRRLQQIAVAIFLEETQAHGITPVQYAALTAAQRQPGLDQRTLASTIGFDTSTIGGVIDRLERRGLIERERSSTDGRAQHIRTTPAGAKLIEAAIEQAKAGERQLLASLSEAERAILVELLHKVAVCRRR